MKTSFVLFTIVWLTFQGAGAQSLSRDEATDALHRAVEFYRTRAGHQGAYLYRYSADLSKQEGEGKAHKTTGWTQPPGTPSVGAAYLDCWQLTGDPVCLEAATETAHALVRGQLMSGGWSSSFELDPTHRKRHAYRTDAGEVGKRRNHTTFDDNKSQSALIFLMRVDEALNFQDVVVHESVKYALKHMLAAQYPNGAWPQQFDEPPNPSEYPVKPASYPDSWPREYPKKDYRGYYTLNDNNMSDIIDMLFVAHRIYNRQDCFEAAKKTAGFFLLAQMPQPQPGWAQQYNLDMQPAWARKFEPPAITGGESQRVMRTLLNVYRHTTEVRYIEPIPRALAYYRSSLLADGQLARFYELRTNKPLYFTKDYELTYSDDDMPTHYAFKVSSKLERIAAEYEKLSAMPAAKVKPYRHEVSSPEMSSRLEKEAREVIAALDERGAWVEEGKLDHHGSDDSTTKVIDSRTFIQRLTTLAEFIGAAKEP